MPIPPGALILLAALAAAEPEVADPPAAPAAAPPIVQGGAHFVPGLHASAALEAGIAPGREGPLLAPVMLELRPGYGFAIGSVNLDVAAQLEMVVAKTVSPVTGEAGGLSWFFPRLVIASPRLVQVAPASLGLTPYLAGSAQFGTTRVLRAEGGGQLDGQLGPAAFGWRSDVTYGRQWTLASPAAQLCRAVDANWPNCMPPRSMSPDTSMGTSAWRWSNTVMAEVLAAPWLSFGASVALDAAWSGAGGTGDEYAPHAVDVNGNPVVRRGPAAADALLATAVGQLRLGEHMGLRLAVPAAMAPGRGAPPFVRGIFFTWWIRTAPALERLWLP
jgi:hypothetical protein